MVKLSRPGFGYFCERGQFVYDRGTADGKSGRFQGESRFFICRAFFGMAENLNDLRRGGRDPASHKYRHSGLRTII
jgi:hypothetical protein